MHALSLSDMPSPQRWHEPTLSWASADPDRWRGRKDQRRAALATELLFNLRNTLQRRTCGPLLEKAALFSGVGADLKRKSKLVEGWRFFFIHHDGEAKNVTLFFLCVLIFQTKTSRRHRWLANQRSILFLTTVALHCCRRTPHTHTHTHTRWGAWGWCLPCSFDSSAFSGVHYWAALPLSHSNLSRGQRLRTPHPSSASVLPPTFSYKLVATLVRRPHTHELELDWQSDLWMDGFLAVTALTFTIVLGWYFAAIEQKEA